MSDYVTRKELIEALEKALIDRDMWFAIATKNFEMFTQVEKERDELADLIVGYVREIDRLLNLAKEIERRLDKASPSPHS